MAIKWKGWTARLPVKICCVILIPVMAFIFLCGCMGFAWMDMGFDEGILFTDFMDNDYFYDSYVPTALSHAKTVFGFQSEENIRNRGCLEWRWVNNATSEQELVSTSLTHRWQTWGSVRYEDLESAEAEQIVANAVNGQLNEYFYSKEWLDTTDGLYYLVTDGQRQLTNLPAEQNVDIFRNHPVYLIEENGRTLEQSRTSESRYSYNRYYDNYYDNGENITVYIAFSQRAVNTRNSEWKTGQRQIFANISLIACSTLAALVFLVILMAGAGRRYADSSNAIRFTALDKPWLDFGLTALIFYEVAVSYFIYRSAETAWYYGNFRWIIALCAVLAAAFMLPLVWWILSFTKYCKAGKWWQHMLLYKIPYWFYRKCRSFIKSLWAGFPLTAKAVGVGISLFAAMAFAAQMGWHNVGGATVSSLGVASVVTVLMLRYTRRLHLVEQGARSASDGIYDAPIPVNGGELGSIAASISSISDGINVAVAERMKSERLKTELITNVSHDIRTPLTSIITYTDLLKNEGLDSEKAPEYLEVLIQKSARLKALTDDLFEASKAASGSIEVHLVPLDLADFVRQVLGELDERVVASGMDFRLNLPEHAHVRADGKLLWRVMENLLSNVFKYALKGSRVYIDVMPDNDGYRLDVKNISEHPLNVDPSELTERFKRGDSARSDEGSGLGLSIAQSFVQAQGGRFALSIDGDLFKATLYMPKDMQ